MCRKLYETPNVPDTQKYEWTTSNNWMSLSNFGKKNICMSLTLIDIRFEGLLANASKIRGRKLGLNRFVDNIQILSENNIVFFKFDCYAEMKKKVCFL